MEVDDRREGRGTGAMSVQRGLVGVACVAVVLVGGACASDADREQVTAADRPRRDNAALGRFIALVVFGLAA
jgi:hypothetical protein